MASYEHAQSVITTGSASQTEHLTPGIANTWHVGRSQGNLGIIVNWQFSFSSAKALMMQVYLCTICWAVKYQTSYAILL